MWPQLFKICKSQRLRQKINMTTIVANTSDSVKKLRELGYAFNKSGELRKIDKTTGEAGDEQFVFGKYKDAAKNKEHYEAIADQIPEIIYDLLEEHGLKRTYIPEGTPQELCTFIFTQPEKIKESKKLLVLIHGSGYVRAGQWARSLIINNSLDHGTQIPYIKKARSLGYDIVITNTNDNYRRIDGILKPIQGLSNATGHAAYVWEHIIIPAKPDSVAIVAHSYGGVVAIDLVRKYPQFFKDKVYAIALTDSSHMPVPAEIRDYIAKTALNWASSEKPLDTPLKYRDVDVPRVSAGHPKHEWSSYAAMDSVFKYLEKKYTEFGSNSSANKKVKLEH